MRRRQTLVAASGMLCLLLASGCGGSAEPQPLPRPTASFDPSESPTPTPPVLPSAAKQKTKAGAEAGARHFLAALNYAGESGDTSAFEDTYVSSCTRCRAITDGIRATYQAGGSIQGGGWIPQRVKFYAIKEDVAFLDVVVDYEAQTLRKDSSADEVHAPPKANVLKTFELVWNGGQWRVGALDPKA